MSTNQSDNGSIKVAVITGGHFFDVPGFHAVFRDMPQVDSYIQLEANWAADIGQALDSYDVFLFYNMPRGLPEERTRPVLEKLGESGQGIFLLHHAILAYEQWPFWSDLVGISDRSFGYDHEQELSVQIADPAHPITQGIDPWQMVDETYSMASASEDSHLLLTTDHPRSMRVLGWTRQFRNARVFCFQSGHDNLTYVDHNFRKTILRGIQWCAGRI
ncbi:MAG: ThuA domain-containing protein [Caldilineaceae bacterium SB0664_bin_27]|uniref:ThuA domain-containing protein n=1 Tax=Caldilineaceae bacterium SB0664_bin_27 TaxID=2605260 RepID=A0A6B0YUQ8_9CHLR|nr:ThuA domain-containing protein [Caldilineaceae bacterium SB0664_bin_27]